MRYSKFFGKTRHDPPCDAESINAKLLTQAGFIEKVAAGIYNLLPLGHRVFTKVCNIIREEMNAVDGQEILMPALHPIDLWEKTGRNQSMDEILYRTTASGNKKFVFGPSHEETVTPLAARYVNSYKDLPMSVYQIQTKFRDEPRAKSGLLRGREFGMKDMYSFHTSEEDLDDYYERATKAYTNVYNRCGLKSYITTASGGAFTDKFSHEFSIPTEAGEDTILICEKCDTAQNLEVAVGKIVEYESKETEKEMQEVDIERGFSVEENAKAHNVSNDKILKTVVYEIENDGFVGVLIRGDLNVNETKLESYFKKKIRSASPEQLKDLGLVRGFISPVNNPAGISFIADHSIKNVKNFVTGSNILNKDLINVNQGRDFQVKDFVDLVEVRGGFICKNCEEKLKEIKAVEAGNIFKLGTKFSKDFGLNFTDQDGKSKPVIMGCYGIGTTRLIGTIVEACNDENGIIWPKSVAPFQIYLISIGKDEQLIKQADDLYNDLKSKGFDVLYDDRKENPGTKFKNADLIGIPVRIVISNRTMENNSVEWKLRDESEAQMINITDLDNKITEFLNN